MTPSDIEIANSAKAIAVREAAKDVWESPLSKGLMSMMYSAILLTIYEGIQFSDFEFHPNTTAVSLMTLGLAFTGGFLIQREKQQQISRRRSEIEVALKRETQRG